MFLKGQKRRLYSLGGSIPDETEKGEPQRKMTTHQRKKAVSEEQKKIGERGVETSYKKRGASLEL